MYGWWLRARAMVRPQTWRLQPFNSTRRRLAALTPGFTALAITAFTNFSPVNPSSRAFLLWTPGEVGLWAGLIGSGIVWAGIMDLKAARKSLSEVQRAEGQRRAIAAIGVAASWDLDLNRLYQRISQDLRSILEFDRFTVTSAQPSGRMRVEFVSGAPDEGPEAGFILPDSPSEPDGLPPENRSLYGSRLTATIPACNGTLTIRCREADRYSANHLELLRQAIAQISPGIANAIVFQASERRLRERTILAEIGRAVTSEQEPHAIFSAVDSSLSGLINYDHLGVILADNLNGVAKSGTIVYWSIDDLAGRRTNQTVRLEPGRFSMTEVFRGTGSDPIGIGPSGEPDSRGSRVWLQTPLVVQEQLIGLLMLSSETGEAIGQDEAAFALNVSFQIAPAIQNAVLNASLKRLADEQRAIAAIGLAANNELKLDAIFNSVAEELAKVVRFDRLSVVYVNPENQQREVAFVQGVEVDGFRVGDVVSTLPETDLATSRTNQYWDWSNASPEFQKLKERGQFLSRASALLGSENYVIGTLHIAKKEPDAYKAQTIDFLERVAIQVTPAIRNARMIAAERELRETLDRQNQELYEANNARKQFLSTVSHELKTPLTIISGFIDLLASPTDQSSETERRDTFSIIRRNADQLDVLINDILDISRLDAGTFKLDPAPFCANELVSDLYTSFQSVLRLKSQVLNVRTPEEETWLAADRARISQVVTNLLSNACKYSPGETQIELLCEVDGDRLHIAVKDQGIGMSEEEQQGLFTAFFRVDNATTRTVPGTGLGLVIAKSITELHGGEIKVSSRPGTGTTFELWLPGLTTKEEAAAAPAAFTGSRLWPERDLDELELGAD